MCVIYRNLCATYESELGWRKGLRGKGGSGGDINVPVQSIPDLIGLIFVGFNHFLLWVLTI